MILYMANEDLLNNKSNKPDSFSTIFEALLDCHYILILGRSPLKLRLRPNMTIAVDWDVKHQFKQTKIIL